MLSLAPSPSSSSKRGGCGGRLKTCAPCGEAVSRGKKSYSTADRSRLDPPRSSGSMDRRAVGIGRARTPARAESSNHKEGRRQCRLGEGTEMVNVGIDVSKERLDVAVRPSGERFAVANTDDGHTQLRKRLAKLKPERIVVEATGGYQKIG